MAGRLQWRIAYQLRYPLIVNATSSFEYSNYGVFLPQRAMLGAII